MSVDANRDYFTSDTHWNHNKIMKYCGRTEFMTPEDRMMYDLYKEDPSIHWIPSKESTDAMNEAMIERINATVPEDATLWHLGDFAFAKTQKQIADIRDRIKCRKVYLIWGNHDKRDVMRMMKDRFVGIYDAQMIYITSEWTASQEEIDTDRSKRQWLAKNYHKTQRIYLHHYAQSVWQHMNKDVWHLYGHSHGMHENWRQRNMPGLPTVDVGVDVWNFAPVSFQTLITFFNDRKRNEANSFEHRKFSPVRYRSEVDWTD